MIDTNVALLLFNWKSPLLQSGFCPQGQDRAVRPQRQAGQVDPRNGQDFG
jgi:hypothetical protein